MQALAERKELQLKLDEVTHEKMSETSRCAKLMKELEMIESRLVLKDNELEELKSGAEKESAVLAGNYERQCKTMRQVEDACKEEIAQQHQLLAQSEGQVKVLERKSQLLEVEVESLKRELEIVSTRALESQVSTNSSSVKQFNSCCRKVQQGQGRNCRSMYLGSRDTFSKRSGDAQN